MLFLPRNLEDHYRSAHQICEDPVCLAKRYVVFSNGIDLAAHSLTFHPFMQVGMCIIHTDSRCFKLLTERIQSNCILILKYLNLVIDLLFKPINQTKRAIPIHFKVRRPQNPEKEKDDDEENDVLTRDTGASHRGNGQYEGGMGGRARGGEWQVEMPPTARDPRDAARALRQAAAEPASFVTAGRAFEDSLEEYPALARVGGGALTIGGWGSINSNNDKKQDFPALGPGPAVRGAGGGGAGRSFSGATTGSYIRDGKVGGAGSQGANDDSWAITNKKAKRLTPSGGVSKPISSTVPAVGWGNKGQGQGQEEETEAASKVDNYPQLSKGPRTFK